MVALAIATLISLLVSMLVLLPECMPGPWQEECVAAKRLSALVYGLTAAVLFALSIILHWKQSRVGSFVEDRVLDGPTIHCRSGVALTTLRHRSRQK
ncbi:MAG TPA: hypothetical protein VFR52_01220 [Sphingomicrobium sp.]|nr:hypothetical protein [Sphingomicrobium sp.]